jgi:hypothetical protein
VIPVRGVPVSEVHPGNIWVELGLFLTIGTLGALTLVVLRREKFL